MANHPDDTEAWYEYGLRFLGSEMPDSAERCFDRALRIDPTDWYPAYGLALGKYFHGDAMAAAVDIERLLRRDNIEPDERAWILTGALDERLGLAEIYLEAGKVDEALGCFERAIQVGDDERREFFLRSRRLLAVKAGRGSEILKWCRENQGNGLFKGTFEAAFAAIATDSVPAARSHVAALRALEEAGNFGGKARRWIRLVSAR